MAESLSESPPQQGPMCPVCFRDYSDSDNNLIPRILQCGHTYCTECLERLLNMEPDDEDNPTMIFNIHYAGRRWTTTRRFPSIFNPPRPPKNDIRCPTCKMENRIENRDITTLTKNFALLGMRSQSSTAAVRPKKSHYCKDHDHEKRVYCRDCKELICAYCQLYGNHKEHNCEIATEAAKPSVENLKEAKERLVNDFDELTHGESAVSSAIVKLERNREGCERKVKRYFNRFIGRLKRRRDDLLLDIGSWTEDQMFVLDAQLKSLSNAIKDSESIQANCQSLIEGDPLEALAQEEDIISEVDGLQERANGLSLQPIINPWIKCKLTRSEYDDSIDEILESCQLKFNTDMLHTKGAMDLSEDETSESESESSMLDGYDDDDDRLSDDHNLAGAGAGGGGGGEQNSSSFQDHTPPVHQLGRSGGGVGGSDLGGASLRDREDRDRDEDLDFLKRRARELLHSQETHFTDGAAGGSVGGGSNRATGGGASFMPKLDLADPRGAGGGAGGGRGRVRRRWDDHPSATGLGGVHQRHSLPLLSPNQASGLSSLRPSGSTPNNTPRRDRDSDPSAAGSGGGDAMSPTQASKSSTSLLFSSSTSNYHRQRILADQLQRAMGSLNQQTAVEDISEEDEDDENDSRDDLDGSSPPRESRHRLHIVEDDTATTLSMLDTYSSQLLQGRMPGNDSDSSDDSLHHDTGGGGNHARSFQVEGEDDESDVSSSSRPYPVGGSGSFVSMTVMDSIEAIRRSRLFGGGRVGEESPIDSDEELETTADQSYATSILDSTLNTNTPNVPGSSPSPSPLQTTEQEDTDFAFGHHLSLPVDSEGRDSEVVFPRHLSWTTDHGEVGGGASGTGSGHGGHGIRLQLEQNGTTLQVSIDSGDLDVAGSGGVLNERDEGGERREDGEEPDWF